MATGAIAILIIFILIAIVAAIVTLGVKGCVFMADIFGIDHRYIPRKTYSPNGMILGFLIGVLMFAVTGNILVGFILGLFVGIGAWVGIFFIEVAFTKATRPLQDKLDEKIDNLFSKNTPSGSGTSSSSSTPAWMKKDEVAANQWKCPKCGAVNPRYVGTCGCGFLLSQVEEAEQRRKEAQKQRMEQERIKREEQQKVFEEEKKNLFSQYDNNNLTSEQETVIRMLTKESGISLQDMCRRLPRSANLSKFKDSVNSLTDMGLITKNDDGKYFLADAKEES